jgi:hypothetical protein
MAIKDNVDFSDFTGRGQGLELFGNSIRKSFSYDSYGDRTKFSAIVLSNPIPIEPKDIALFTNSKQENTQGSKKLNKFVYRARIIGENSPHEFLPDPCDSTFASDQQQALKIIAMHTLFVSNVESGVADSLPRINSIVEVELNKNVFGYNLQYGKHVKVITNPDKESGTDVDCDSLQNIMSNADASPVWSYESGENCGGPPLNDPKVNEIYDAYIKKTGGKFAPEEGMCGNLPGFPLEKCKTGTIGGVSVTLHPKFFDIVKQKYDMVKAQNFDEKFTGGSSIRSVKTQISLRIGNAAKAGNELNMDQYISGNSSLCNPPTAPLPTYSGGGSRHIYGCAIDFGGILSHGGTRIAKLPDSIARKSKTYNYLLSLQEDGFKNFSKEPWHWSVDGK